MDGEKKEGESSCVQVAVRVRPLTKNSDGAASSSLVRTNSAKSRFRRHKQGHALEESRAWTCSSTTVQQMGVVRRVEGKSLFTFDHVFDEDASTTRLYETVVRPIVWGTTKGKHGTVFCYGQTGSGKTHTMLGQSTDFGSDGLLQLAVKDLFRWIDGTNHEAMVIVSYFEVYNERVNDLLSGVVSDPDDTASGNSVQSEQQGGEVHVKCRRVQVHNVATVLDLLQFGNQHRTVGSTDVNARSSRSHAIFRVSLETRADTKLLQATLNLVDLAGSENSQSSGTSHERQKEGGKINQSLLSLSKVINALSTPAASRPRHINYRDSKLTFILQPHLSGNASMAIVCCVSPSGRFVAETRSTLRFASRAKLVETKAQVNKVRESDSALIRTLNVELNETRQVLEATEKRSIASEQASVEAASELKRLKELIFGDGDFQIDDGLADLKKKRRVVHQHEFISIPTIDETKVSIESVDMLENNPNNLSYSRVTKHRDLLARGPAHLPPTEVMIMTEQAHVPEYDHASSSLYANDMEHRAKFLLSRLESTEDMVDALKRELKSARKAMHQLVSKNVTLGSKVERYHRKMQKIRDESEGKYRQQYVLLKLSMYISVLFFCFGLHDLFVVMVMFVWLTLASYTAE